MEHAEQSVLRLAHITLGNLDIGVSLDQVRQVIPWPEHLHKLPRRQNALLGIFSHRNQTIPLVDLHSWLGIANIDEEKLKQVMILGCEGKSIAFAVDDLHGLKRFAQHKIQQVYQDADDDEFFHSVVTWEEKNRFINLLDTERLLRKAQLWSTHIAATPPALKNRHLVSNNIGNTSEKSPYISFYVGDHLLTVPALSISEVLIKPQHQEVLGMSSTLLGMARWRNRDLPVINLPKLLHDEHDADQCNFLIVIKNEQNQIIGLPVSNMCAVINVQHNDIKTTNPLVHNKMLCGSVLTEQKEKAFIIDCDYLFKSTDWPTISVSKAFNQSANEAKLHATEESSGYLVFEANGAWATSIKEIRAILPLPTVRKLAKQTIEGILGYCEWRNHDVPVVDLRKSTACNEEKAQIPRLIIINDNNQYFGFIVDNVVELLPTQYSQHTKGFMAGRTFHVITVTHGEKRSYHVKELSDLCHLKAAS